MINELERVVRDCRSSRDCKTLVPVFVPAVCSSVESIITLQKSLVKSSNFIEIPLRDPFWVLQQIQDRWNSVIRAYFQLLEDSMSRFLCHSSHQKMSERSIRDYSMIQRSSWRISKAENISKTYSEPSIPGGGGGFTGCLLMWSLLAYRSTSGSPRKSCSISRRKSKITCRR